MAAQYSIAKVDELTDDFLCALTDICTRAFADEPVTPLLAGDRPEALAWYFRSVIAAGHLGGEVCVATLKGSLKPVSLSVWMPPGKDLWDTEEQRQLGFYDYMSSLDPLTKEFMSTTYVEFIGTFFRDALSPRTKENSWVCHVVATDPAYQRQGIGSAVVNTTIVKVKLEGKDELLALCAVNEKNMRWYSKLGFRVAGHVPEFAAPKGSVPVWALTMNV